MKSTLKKQRFLITGSAGFIGFHVAKVLLESGQIVHGYDAITDYYDVKLKLCRLEILGKFKDYSFTKGMLEDRELLCKTFSDFTPDVVIHLAAQAGVRYSLSNPEAYISSNVTGTFHVIELSKKLQVRHLLMASTSSVYGANVNMPFNEKDKADTPLTIYAATKKATESIGHAYAHLYKLPITVFRFFTVYGPWGRPDMALFKFTKGILGDTPIDIYNHGDMYRDFTFIDDLVNAILLLVEAVPVNDELVLSDDSISPVAPFRVVNIGNSQKVRLLDFIEAIESELGKPAIRNYMPMQKGDVPATWADSSLLTSLTDYSPTTSFRDGVRQFVSWYREFYEI